MQVNANSVNSQKQLPIFLRFNKCQSVELKVPSSDEFCSCAMLSTDSSAGGEARGPTYI